MTDDDRGGGDSGEDGSDGGDPFEDLDVDERGGDPFEELGGPGPGFESGSGDPPDAAGDDPLVESDDVGGEQRDSTLEDGREDSWSWGGPGGEPSGEEAFGGPDPRGDPFEEAGDAFSREGVDDLDPDEVWERLDTAENIGSVSERDGDVYAEVSKHSYCEGCEWFAEPPEVACTHEGTEIVEFLDMETVRLLNCPVVAERREIREND